MFGGRWCFSKMVTSCSKWNGVLSMGLVNVPKVALVCTHSKVSGGRGNLTERKSCLLSNAQAADLKEFAVPRSMLLFFYEDRI